MCKWIRSSHMSASVRLLSAFPVLTSSSPPPLTLFPLFASSFPLFSSHQLFSPLCCSPHLQFSLPIPVSILPCSFSCNLSVISLHVFMKYVCFGEYEFMHVRFTVCNEQATLNHNANEKKYPIQFSICIEFIVTQQFLSFCFSLCLSMTTRVVTSVTYQLISPWCGMETLSLTTRSTFKVQYFLLFYFFFT